MPRILVIRGAERVARRSRSSVIVCFENNRCREYPLRDIAVFVVYGSGTMIESSTLTVLAETNIPTVVVTGHGVATLYGDIRVRDWTARRAQYLLDETRRVTIMSRILYAKTRGMYNVAVYHGAVFSEKPVLTIEATSSEKGLRLWEAEWARAIWSSMPGLLQYRVREWLVENGYPGTRDPRSLDPFNRSLTLLYAILYGIGTRALLAVGLDPTYGLLHRTRNSTPLTFDYVEQFKPLAVDAVIRVFRSNNYQRIRVGEDGNLEKDSIRILLEQFYTLFNAKISGTRHTPHRLAYLNAFKLRATILGSNKPYTYTHTPTRLRTKTKQRKPVNNPTNQ